VRRKSLRARGAAWLAHWTVNPEVAGSSPVEPAIKTMPSAAVLRPRRARLPETYLARSRLPEWPRAVALRGPSARAGAAGARAARMPAIIGACSTRLPAPGLRVDAAGRRDPGESGVSNPGPLRGAPRSHPSPPRRSGQRGDGRGETVTKTQMLMEGSSKGSGAASTGVQFHITCFHLWDVERQVLGHEPSGPADQVAGHECFPCECPSSRRLAEAAP
jgi:hypothetical protein